MFETVIVIHPILVKELKIEISAEDSLDEAIGLARAIELDVVHSEIIRLSRVMPATLLGGGVIERLAEMVEEKNIGLVYINHALTPVQQRNLETRLNAKVIDRTGLILEIFGARARTKEGKLQVELAALDFQRSRLVRSWTHLERQRGGFGFTGGPGETQIEIDRRLIGERMTRLKKQLEQVKKNRRLQRSSRERTPFPVVALVGYTNAGKSTLFNKLTGADVFVQDLLFATLDPTMRALVLPSGKKVILSDTVGFISDLPTHLVASFRATLEEVQNASVILYVRDVTHQDENTERQSVATILKELDIDMDKDERIIEVVNKIDLLPDDECHDARHMAISAVTGEGLPELMGAIDSFLAKDEQLVEVSLDMTQDGAALSWLYDHGYLLLRKDKDCMSYLKFSLSEKDVNRFQQKYKHINVKLIIRKEGEDVNRTAKGY